MQHKRRIAAAAALAAVVLAVTWGLWTCALPLLVKRFAAQTLRNLGFADVRVNAASVRPLSVVVTDVNAGRSLSIDSVVVGFGLLSLLRRRAETINVYGAVTRVAVDTQGVSWPPLERLGDSGAARPRIPFARLLVGESAVWLGYRQHWILVPVRGQFTRRGSARLRVEASAAPLGGELTVEGTADIGQPAGSYRVHFKGIGPEAAALVDSLWPSLPDVALDGTLHGTVDFDNDEDGWTLRGGLGSTQARLRWVVDGLGLVWQPDTGTVVLAHGEDDTVRVELAGVLNGGRFEGHVVRDSWNGQVRGAVQARDLPATFVADLLEHFTGLRPAGAVGAVAATARGTLNDDTATLRMVLDARSVRLRWHRGDEPWQLYPGGITGTVGIARARDGWLTRRIELESTRSAASGDGWRVGWGRFSTTLRTQGAGDATRGEFAVREVSVGDVALPGVSGTVGVDSNEVRFEARGALLARAALRLSGRLRWGEGGLDGWVHGVVPRFRLAGYAGRGADWWPFERGTVVGGGFRLEGRAVFRAGELDYWAGIDVRNGVLRRTNPRSSVVGLSGAAAFVSFAPPITAQAYEFTFDSISIGMLRAGRGRAYVSAGRGIPVLVRDLRCGWAGGTLRADSVRIYPDESLIALTVRLNDVELQRIIDAFEYRGIRGTGTVFGRVELRIRWAPEPRVDLLGGSIEAGPAPGTLALSAETARTVLGVDEDFAPRDPTLREEVTLLILEALQNLLYTQLRVSIGAEDGGESVTRIQVQGRGPRGAAEDDQIPIGGLTIDIHGFGRLLNGLLFGGLGGADIDVR